MVEKSQQHQKKYSMMSQFAYSLDHHSNFYMNNYLKTQNGVQSFISYRNKAKNKKVY